MSQSELHAINRATQSMHEWLNELRDLVDWEDNQRVYRLLRVTIQALRDWLDVNEASHLGAQLPLLVRGIYYEGWHPAGTPVAERSKEAFLARLEEAFKADPIDDPDEAVICGSGCLTDGFHTERSKTFECGCQRTCASFGHKKVEWEPVCTP